MKKIVILKETAKEDLLQINDYIAKDSIFYANRTIENIHLRINNLVMFPELGKEVQINKQNVRQLIYKSYKIFYQFNSKDIYVLRVIHHSRDIYSLKI